MFQGFNEATVSYFEAIKKENSKRMHKEKEGLYLEGVKYPLEELYYEWYSYFSRLDPALLGDKRRCISSAYNDARFCRDAPVREYFYLRFKLSRADKRNELGFFFDASLDGYRYGLNIYHMDARGIERIRAYLLDNRRAAKKELGQLYASGLLSVYGETYKRANYPQETGCLRDWLEHRRISVMHKEVLNPTFYDRELLYHICAAFDSARGVYRMMERALSGS